MWHDYDDDDDDYMKQKGFPKLEKGGRFGPLPRGMAIREHCGIWLIVNIEIQKVKIISYFRKQIDDAYDRRESNMNTYGNCFYV